MKLDLRYLGQSEVRGTAGGAEVRFAPEQHLDAGLTLHEVVRAVLDGFAIGTKEAANEGRRIVVRTILSAMRQATLDYVEIDELMDLVGRGPRGNHGNPE